MWVCVLSDTGANKTLSEKFWEQNVKPAPASCSIDSEVTLMPLTIRQFEHVGV